MPRPLTRNAAARHARACLAAQRRTANAAYIWAMAGAVFAAGMALAAPSLPAAPALCHAAALCAGVALVAALRGLALARRTA